MRRYELSPNSTVTTATGHMFFAGDLLGSNTGFSATRLRVATGYAMSQIDRILRPRIRTFGRITEAMIMIKEVK